MASAAAAALEWLALTYVSADFPHLKGRTFRLPPEHAYAARELIALGFVRAALQGSVELTSAGLAWIMTNRPDLDDDTWSNDVDNFRDTASARYAEANFPACRSFPLGEMSNRLRGELRALGFIQRTTLGSSWQLTPAGQQWLMANLAA
jgi:hypothetical protein